TLIIDLFGKIGCSWCLSAHDLWQDPGRPSVAVAARRGVRRDLASERSCLLQSEEFSRPANRPTIDGVVSGCLRGSTPGKKEIPLRRLWLGTVLVLGAAVALWGGVRAVGARRARLALDQAKREMAAGRYDRAWEWLSGLAPGWAGDGEVDYQLGLCE